MGKIEYIAVQCFQCKVFQVERTKKQNKWTCKICNSKQSVRKVYAISTQAKDIRLVVQELNMKRKDVEEELEKQKLLELQESQNDDGQLESIDDVFEQHRREQEEELRNKQNKPRVSKWAKFIEVRDDDYDDEEDETCTTMLPTDQTQTRKRKRSKKDDTFEDEFKDEHTQTSKRKKKFEEMHNEYEESTITKQRKIQKRNTPIQNQAKKPSKWAQFLPKEDVN